MQLIHEKYKKIIPFSELITRQNFPPLQKREVHLWTVSLNADSSLIKQCKTSLSDIECNRISFFKFPQVQNNYIISQGILRQLLAGYLDIEPCKIQIGRHRKGKPFTKDDPSLFFNMSNSGNLCVYAFSRDNEVGIDLENIRNLPDLDELIQKNFTRNEIKYIDKNKKDRLRRFFLFWTIKESYLKAVGEGMRLPLDNLEFVIENGKIKLVAIKGIFEPDDWHFKEMPLSNNYIRTLTFKGEQIRFVERTI